MKFIKQFLIIILISFIGEALRYFLPFPVPASIYGLVLLFIGLQTGLIRLHQVREVGHFLVDIMPILFIPACVGLMDAWGKMRTVLFPLILITVVSTILVMTVSGRVTQRVIRIKNKNTQKGDEPHESTH